MDANGFENGIENPGIKKNEIGEVRPVETTVTERPGEQFAELKKTLLDPKEISQKYNPEGEEEARKKCLMIGEEIASNLRIMGTNNEKRNFLNAELIEVQNKQREIAKDKKKREDSGWIKLKNVFGMKDKKILEDEQELTQLKTEETRCLDDMYEIRRIKEDWEERSKKMDTPEDVMKEHFEKMAETPLTVKEKMEYLKPEFMASLSKDEYVTLWRRLNPNYVAHTTRQGFRDHIGMWEHSGGQGEFWDGFNSIMEGGGKLKNAFENLGLDDMKGETVKKFVEEKFIKDGAESPESVKYTFEKMVNNLKYDREGKAASFPDRTSLHMTEQDVADHIYGAETGNEVFFVFPTDFIASQYNFGFDAEKGLTEPVVDTRKNNVFVWPGKGEMGISIDSGFVFLPSNTLVDPETGSRYASEVKNVQGIDMRVPIEEVTEEGKKVWKAAENPITAKEYWEKKFANNPDKRPKHVHYYDGDPSAAVREFLTENKINKKANAESLGKYLGFDENMIADMDIDERVNAGRDELVEMGKKIIDEYYASRT